MTAPALGLVARPVRPPEPRTPGWGAVVVAVVLTLLLGIFMASGLVVRSGWILPDRAADAPQAERLTWVDVPPAALPAPAEPTVAGAPTAERPASPLPNSAAPRLPGVPSTTRPVLPPFPVAPTAPVLPATSRDTASGAPAADARRPSTLAPQAVIPHRVPGATLPPPASAGDRLRPNVTCAAPCAGAERVGVGIGGSDLTREEQAEALRALGRAVPGMAAARGKAPAGAPEPRVNDPNGRKELGGVTLHTGLPWGGPTKAERERDARLHAENKAILARIKTRAESLAVLDSLERARRAPGQRPPR